MSKTKSMPFAKKSARPKSNATKSTGGCLSINGGLEAHLRETEAEVHSLENLLPIQHNHQAAIARYRAARKRAMQATEELRSARQQWQKTLTQLGLTESLSPKSIRIMAEGYESLTQTRRRMKSLEEELEARQLELGAITQRIDALARQAFAAKAASDAIVSGNPQDEFDDAPRAVRDLPRRQRSSRSGPM